ncbi:hypothetical protein PR048_028879 [Dryococelus australis]|uniref:Uncharacterized protein n=1 Tax=Dryococelus australis TaxID=614101 RepID=A0ABQ9GBT3_9NEOP|nr:hypothetical protein PR048_028879 [Dryococelus australis]
METGIRLLSSPSSGIRVRSAVRECRLMVAHFPVLLVADTLATARVGSSGSIMVGTGATMSAFRLVRSKLRKRDDNHNAVTDVVAASPQQTAVSTICSAPAPFSDQQLPQANGTAPPPPPLFLWQYPVYSNDQDSLMHTLPADRPGICRGFRKNLRGRWRRLVKRKPAPEACTIPAELRDQLKQIYVY